MSKNIITCAQAFAFIYDVILGILAAIAIAISILYLTGQVSKAAVTQVAPETETRPTEIILDEDTCTYIPEGTRFWMPER